MASSESERSDRSIENLIGAYAALVDAGDFAGLGELFAEAVFGGSGDAVRGAEQVEKLFRAMVHVYEDGTPRTKHVTTNIRIDVDDGAGTAVAHAYVTVFQALPDLPLQPIVAGRYRDVFGRRVAFRGAALHDRPRRRRQPPSARRAGRVGTLSASHAPPSPSVRGPSDITLLTMRDAADAGRGRISLARVQLLASKTVEGEDTVTVRELHMA